MGWWNEQTSKNSASISAGAASDTGVARDRNEDAYGGFASQETEERLFIVADGMDGHERGQEASRTAVAAVHETFFNTRRETVLERLRRAFHEANERVHGDAENRKTGGSMGTTATAVAREMQRRGALTAEEARMHPRRGTLTRAIGVEPTVEVDVREIGPFQAGDHLLLCTDGLENLSETVLREEVLDNAPLRACKQLVQRANKREGHDNATALVVHRVRP
jgi:serine/threonine protein phosphatase PrpC